jgi:hypothetical protein
MNTEPDEHADHGTHYEGNSLVCSCGAHLGTFSVAVDDPDDAAGRVSDEQ